MIEALVASAVVIAAFTFAWIGTARQAARDVLRAKLERREIRLEEYAAHIRALDDAA